MSGIEQWHLPSTIRKAHSLNYPSTTHRQHRPPYTDQSSHFESHGIPDAPSRFNQSPSAVRLTESPPPLNNKDTWSIGAIGSPRLASTPSRQLLTPPIHHEHLSTRPPTRAGSWRINGHRPTDQPSRTTNHPNLNEFRSGTYTWLAGGTSASSGSLIGLQTSTRASNVNFVDRLKPSTGLERKLGINSNRASGDQSRATVGPSNLLSTSTTIYGLPQRLTRPVQLAVTNTRANLVDQQQKFMMSDGPSINGHPSRCDIWSTHSVKSDPSESSCDFVAGSPSPSRLGVDPFSTTPAPNHIVRRRDQPRSLLDRQRHFGAADYSSTRPNQPSSMAGVIQSGQLRSGDKNESVDKSEGMQQESRLLFLALSELRDTVLASNATLEASLAPLIDSEYFSSLHKHRHHHSHHHPYDKMGVDRHNKSVGPSVGLKARFDSRRRRSVQLRHSVEYGRDEKVTVDVRIVFLKIGEIDTLREMYYADAFVQGKWREPKLDDKNVDDFSCAELEQYWNPLLYIDNILTETKDTQWLIAQKNDAGQAFIVQRRRVKGIFMETLELNDFPLDVQEWKLYEHVEITKSTIKEEYSSSAKSHPCISVTCRAARRPGYFYWNVFLIMFMISGLSFATFTVTPDKAELRLRLSFTLILTSVTFKYVISQSLPKISYLTYMDKYVLMSLAILCIISIWHALVTLLYPVSETRSPFVDFNATFQCCHNLSLAMSPNLNKFNASSPTNLPVNITQYNSKTTTNSLSLACFNHCFKHHNRHSYWDSINEGVDYQCDRNNSTECHEWAMVRTIEQHVVTSFVIIYFLFHVIFIIWFYVDRCICYILIQLIFHLSQHKGSKRRREMQEKDREYRQFLRRVSQHQTAQQRPVS